MAPRRHHANAIPAFIVVPAEDSAFPGLNPVDAPEAWTPRRGKGPSAVSIGTFTFDIAAIADHIQVLFPFLTPGLSLKQFVAAAPREVRQRLGNPFAAANVI